jgi:GNAT superfamily N-acetyltransferase
MESMRISTEPDELDVAMIHDYLNRESYWARGIPLSTLQRAIDHSLCFGGYVGTHQVAFARVISDYATFANLVDVFVLLPWRGRGYASALMAAIVADARLQGLRRFMLATADAHGLYARFGFRMLARPERMMERHDPGVYGVQPETR